MGDGRKLFFTLRFFCHRLLRAKGAAIRQGSSREASPANGRYCRSRKVDSRGTLEFFLTAPIEQAAEDSKKAGAILDLYERLQERVLDLTHSQFAVPLLDRLFERPVFQSSHLEGLPNSPSKQAVATLLTRLKNANILKVVREGSGRPAQVLALAELVNLCEGRAVV